MKRRSDSVLDRLTPDQRAAVETWLFEENCSFESVASRLADQFQISTSESALGRFYQRLASKRLIKPFAFDPSTCLVRPGVVTFTQPCSIGVSDLARLLSEATAHLDCRPAAEPVEIPPSQPQNCIKPLTIQGLAPKSVSNLDTQVRSSVTP